MNSNNPQDTQGLTKPAPFQLSEKKPAGKMDLTKPAAPTLKPRVVRIDQPEIPQASTSPTPTPPDFITVRRLEPEMSVASENDSKPVEEVKTSPNGPDHFAGGMMWRLDPNGTGEIQFLVIDYTEERCNTNTKFPGGGSRIGGRKPPFKFRVEEPWQTLFREWQVEVGQKLLTTGNDPIKFAVPSRSGGGDHTKYFFPLMEVDVSDGTLRTEMLKEEEPGSPTEHLGPPRWLSAERLLRVMVGHHLMALQEILPGIQTVADQMRKTMATQPQE